jgi:hypothetical protein
MTTTRRVPTTTCATHIRHPIFIECNCLACEVIALREKVSKLSLEVADLKATGPTGATCGVVRKRTIG